MHISRMTVHADSARIEEASSSRQQDLTVRLPDGRMLGYAEYGAPDGLPVLGFHGTPGSRLMFRIAHEAALEANIRLIAPERPGFGISSPHHGRTLTSYAADIASFADRLGLDKFAVAGISGGGPYAVACGAFLRERITALGLISPIGPVCGPDKPNKIGPGHYFAFRIAPRLLPFSAFACSVGRFAFLHAPQLMYAFILSRASSTDWPVLSRPDVRQNLLAGVAEGCRPGVRATMQELAIFSRCWNIPYQDITAPVLFWQGLNDRNVPVAAALQLAKLIPNCRTETIKEAGHYWIFDNISAVLKEISRTAQGNQNAHKTGVTNP